MPLWCFLVLCQPKDGVLGKAYLRDSTRALITTVRDPRGREGVFHYDATAMRQYVIVGMVAAAIAAPPEGDCTARQAAQERQLTQILSRSLRVDLRQATFYLRASSGDIRAAMRLHGEIVSIYARTPRMTLWHAFRPLQPVFGCQSACLPVRNGRILHFLALGHDLSGRCACHVAEQDVRWERNRPRGRR